ncbi:hypothetical protein B0J13DRAFT_681032 [Dactylonectria estremocensis]|uniref:Uncharacterized protein n=1 Tax=Dactylonectria estremocensis TaxID=1079267 RepID=A0A9P9IE10_9HYPO|nr:hypothetical protein B0J13DRAFT_681032 [Dactylonectria estremocensis]
MYGLSIGISNIGDSLPGPVYALLSGLNASTVGIIAVAAVQLSEKAITDKITHILVFLGGAAGILYNALWYFPLLMFLTGVATVVHDYRWLHGPVKVVVSVVKNPRRRRLAEELESVELSQAQSVNQHNTATATATSSDAATERNEAGTRSSRDNNAETLPVTENGHPGTESEPRVVPPERSLNFSWTFGLGIIVFFLITFIVIMVLRGVLPVKSLLTDTPTNLPFCNAGPVEGTKLPRIMPIAIARRIHRARNRSSHPRALNADTDSASSLVWLSKSGLGLPAIRCC